MFYKNTRTLCGQFSCISKNSHVKKEKKKIREKNVFIMFIQDCVTEFVTTVTVTVYS